MGEEPARRPQYHCPPGAPDPLPGHGVVVLTHRPTSTRSSCPTFWTRTRSSCPTSRHRVDRRNHCPGHWLPRPSSRDQSSASGSVGGRCGRAVANDFVGECGRHNDLHDAGQDCPGGVQPADPTSSPPNLALDWNWQRKTRSRVQAWRWGGRTWGETRVPSLPRTSAFDSTLTTTPSRVRAWRWGRG